MRNLVMVMGLLAFVGCQPAEEATSDAVSDSESEEAAAADSTDPTVTEPANYTVEFENDYVRAVRIKYAAGEETGMHSHPASVSVFLTDADGVLVMEDGSEMEFKNKAGESMLMDAQSHRPRANTDFELIQIELKGGGGTAVDEAMDSVAVAPDHYQTVVENDRVRVVRITYAADDESELHSHPNGVLVALTEGSGEIIPKDGEKREVAFEAGAAIWHPAETHAGMAKTDLDLVLVELK